MKTKIGIAGAVVGLTLVGTFGAVACSSSDAPTDKTKAAVTHETPRPKSTPSVPSMSERVQDWYPTVTPDINTLVDDLNDASSAADIQDVDGMTTACSNGQTDTKTLAGNAAYPADPALWNTAVTDLDNAFADCVNGNYDDASAGFTQVGTDFNQLTASVTKYL